MSSTSTNPVDQPYFLQVSYEDTCFLLDCSSVRDGTIRDLQSFYETELAKLLACPVRIPSILFRNHALISSPDYKTAQIFENFATVHCLSEDAFFKLHQPLLKNEFVSLSKVDLKDNIEKWISFHEHQRGALAVRLGGSNHKPTYLALHTMHSLSQLQDGSVLDSLEDSTANWFITSKFQRNGELFSFVVQIKSSSDTSPSQWIVNFSFNSYGRVEFNSMEDSTPDEVEAKVFIDYRSHYNLPKVISRVGDDIVDPLPKGASLSTYPSLGNLPLTISTSPEPIVKVAQSTSSSGDKFATYFTLSNCVVANMSDEDLSVKDVQLFYETIEKTWEEMNGVCIGEDPYFRETRNFNLAAKSNCCLSVKGHIMVTGESGDDYASRSRIPKALPPHLRMKVVFTSFDGKEASKIFEKANPPLSIPTKESLEASWEVSIDDFVYCDNTIKDERIYVAIYQKGRDKVIRLSTGTYYTFTDPGVEKSEFQAKERGKEEEKFDYWSSNNCSGEVFFLYDKESNYRLYGIRIELRTPTNSICSVVPFPVLHPEKYKVTLLTPTKDITVKTESVSVLFEGITEVRNSDKIAIAEEKNKLVTQSYISYIYNESNAICGEVSVPLKDLLVGKKYVAQYISYENNCVLAYSRPFSPSR